jgi:hypothetical protein
MDFLRGGQQSSAVTVLAVTAVLAAGTFLATNVFGKSEVSINSCVLLASV